MADSGAALSVFPREVVPPGTRLWPSTSRLRSATGHPLTNDGTIEVTAVFGSGAGAKISAIVTSDLFGPPLVYLSDLNKLGVSMQFPEGTEMDEEENYEIKPINMLAEEFQLLGDGDDSLDQIKEDFKDVLCSMLGEAAGGMKGPKMKIEIDENKNFKPCQVTTTRQVPAHMESMAKKLLDELEANGAVRRYDGPTPCTSPGHFVLKKCGKKVRLVTDYRILNQFVKRTVRPFRSANELMKRVHPSSKWFCKLDAIHGYFQVPLDEPSSLLTAFLLFDGKRIYLVAPMGLVSSSDEFNIRSDNAVAAFS